MALVGDTVRLATHPPRDIGAASIDSVFVRSSGAGVGALVGAVGFGLMGAVAASGLQCSDLGGFGPPPDCHPDTGTTVGGFLVGAVVGAGVGGIIGSLVKTWKRIYP